MGNQRVHRALEPGDQPVAFENLDSPARPVRAQLADGANGGGSIVVTFGEIKSG